MTWKRWAQVSIDKMVIKMSRFNLREIGKQAFLQKVNRQSLENFLLKEHNYVAAELQDARNKVC